MSAKTSAKIFAQIGKIIEKPGLEIRPDMHLATDLGMDSLQIAELISFLGQNYDIEDLHPEDLETVQSVLEAAEGAKPIQRPVQPMSQARWPAEENRPAPFLPLGRTIPESVLMTCDLMKDFPACGDDLVGVLRYSTVKMNALVLAGALRRYPEEHIGVLLPASVGTAIVVFAIQLAGKTPVMLNWTLGPRNLEEMARLAKVKTVISSWRFLERLSHVDFGSLIDSIQLIEDIRENLTIGMKLRGALRSLCRNQTILRSLRLHQIERRPDCRHFLYQRHGGQTQRRAPVSSQYHLRSARVDAVHRF